MIDSKAVTSHPASRNQGMNVREYVEGYEFRGESDYTPNDREKTLIEDAIAGYLTPRVVPVAEVWRVLAERFGVERDHMAGPEADAAMAALLSATSPAAEIAGTVGETITARYTNWRGETAVRTFIPRRVFFGSNEWRPEPQVLIEATDCEKGALRTFAAAGFAHPAPAAPAGEIEAAAKAIFDEDRRPLEGFVRNPLTWESAELEAYHPGLRDRMRRFARAALSASPAPGVETHDYVPDRKYPWFCAKCGYAEHEPLQHTAAAIRSGEKA
ncbi:hypothetical protein AB4Z40_08930 [Bosea sp. 2YAB26]|uniref:hypothetical protein n=1 Tax=Bosea sp. 2YAB26 TaxID=3237478 RepID=UPI003F929A6C